MTSVVKKVKNYGSYLFDDDHMLIWHKWGFQREAGGVSLLADDAF